MKKPTIVIAIAAALIIVLSAWTVEARQSGARIHARVDAPAATANPDARFGPGYRDRRQQENNAGRGAGVNRPGNAARHERHSLRDGSQAGRGNRRGRHDGPYGRPGQRRNATQLPTTTGDTP